MKLSESWLREWVNPAISVQDICHKLTMAGLEVDALEPIASDMSIDISITPNRGDCLSVKGVARDLAAITSSPLLTPVSITPISAAMSDTLNVENKAPDACPRYVGRIIKQVKSDSPTPAWISDRLACYGIRSINCIVDVTNYVMLELGQPMHAFDLKTIEQEVVVRMSQSGEKITLLDDSKQVLDDATLIIADKQKPLAIAGVMGGLDSGVTTLTNDIFLESAYFDPQVVARQRQYYQLNSDSSYRFERGVDPAIQRDAIERATQLILEIAGGKAGEVIESISKDHLPVSPVVTLTQKKLDKVLGVSIDANVVSDIFQRLGFKRVDGAEWTITVPSYRFDIKEPEDLIEEVVRLYGYDNIPVHTPVAALQSDSAVSTDRDFSTLAQAFINHGYHEIISYSFIDKDRQLLLDPERTPVELVNPISADMSTMRTNLWPGLLNTLIYNVSRQQTNIRLFEMGTCFMQEDGRLVQMSRLGGLISGHAQPEQWGVSARKADFYDLKGSLEDILTVWLGAKVVFEPGQHPALHPGQTAFIDYQGVRIGVMGALHPAIIHALDLPDTAFIFEIDLAQMKNLGKPLIQDVSKYPEIRRDIAILVNQTIPGDKIQATIKTSAGDWLKDVFIFDVYHGKGISPGLKSIALALIWQHPARTLVDEEVATLMEQVTSTLKGKLGAELRS